MTAATCCRVPGCQLAPTGLYFQKYRICRQHYSAAVLDLGLDELHRFCQVGRRCCLKGHLGCSRLC